MKQIKRCLLLIVLMIGFVLMPSANAKAQDPVTEAIRQGVIKVIKAIDLQMQRLQTRTIWLQNAQKVIENTMSELKLSQISDWTERQRTLYADYFDELSKVKSIISYYHRIKSATEKQVALVKEYKHAYSLFKQDKNFSPGDLDYMQKIYSGIMDESIKNADQILLVINSFSTQMTDARRLEIINNAADGIETNYSDLKAFNAENVQLSLQRSKDQHDIDIVKKLYGLQ